jgi:hypothetical protein
MSSHGEEGQRGKFNIQIPFHSVAHFGSPIFNRRGHLVGISYAPMDAWSVSFIQEAVQYAHDMGRYYVIQYSYTKCIKCGILLTQVLKLERVTTYNSMPFIKQSLYIL